MKRFKHEIHGDKLIYKGDEWQKVFITTGGSLVPNYFARWDYWNKLIKDNNGDNQKRI